MNFALFICIRLFNVYFRGFYLFKRDLSIALISIFFMLNWILPSQAAKDCEKLQSGPSGIVSQVVDGDSVLFSNGDKIRLIGIQAPKLALGREGFKDWPLAEEARLALEEIVLGKQVHLKYGGAKRDRYNRILAHMFVVGDEGSKEVWVQKAMLEKGFARVYSFADNRFCLDELLATEAKARVERYNIWSNSFYDILHAQKPNKILKLVDSYELIEGVVVSAKRVGVRIYLNFGKNYRDDFTIVIDKRGRGVFKKAGIDPLDLENALIRVRGWVEKYDGPRIDVTHPEQIEVLARR